MDKVHPNRLLYTLPFVGEYCKKNRGVACLRYTYSAGPWTCIATE